jgi:hypothetical protein
MHFCRDGFHACPQHSENQRDPQRTLAQPRREVDNCCGICGKERSHCRIFGKRIVSQSAQIFPLPMANEPSPQRKLANLSVEQMKAALPKLDRRIADLKAFDVNSVQKRFDPALEVLFNKVIAPAIKILKKLPRTSVRGMQIRQN